MGLFYLNPFLSQRRKDAKKSICLCDFAPLREINYQNPGSAKSSTSSSLKYSLEITMYFKRSQETSLSVEFAWQKHIKKYRCLSSLCDLYFYFSAIFAVNGFFPSN
jgi:hypothetical protein